MMARDRLKTLMGPLLLVPLVAAGCGGGQGQESAATSATETVTLAVTGMT